MGALSRSEYEHYLYSLLPQHPQVSRSTLRLFTNSSTTAIIRGEVELQNGLAIRVFEFLDFSDESILEYSYAVYQGEEKIRWYDAQPHPENLALQSTFPHHFHAAPDIKHNRQPAKGIGFKEPNLPTVIADCLLLSNS
jgi:hypothetical protein